MIEAKTPIDLYIDALENNNTEKAISLIRESSMLLLEKTEDNWSALSLAIYYQNHEVLNFILGLISKEHFIKEQMHPIEVALKFGDKKCIEKLMFNFEKLPEYIADSQKNNLLHICIKNELVQAAKYIYEVYPEQSLYENRQGKTPMMLAAEKNNNELLELFLNSEVFNKTDIDQVRFLINKTIQNNQPDLFRKLYGFLSNNNISCIDELFYSAVSLNSPSIIKEIINTGDFIAGHKEIASMINIACSLQKDDAAKNACKEIIDYLFEIKVPFFKFKNENGQSAWMLSIKNKNWSTFYKLLGKKECINHFDNEGCSPLHYAVEYGEPKHIELLLKNGANPDVANNFGIYPIHRSVVLGQIGHIKALAPAMKNINCLNMNSETPLQIAIKNRNFRAVSYLIWAGAEIAFSPYTEEQEQVVYEGLPNGSVEQVKYFIETRLDNFSALAKIGFNLNQKNDMGDPFLHHFIKNNQLSNFKTLLSCVGNPNEVDASGNSPLILASMKSNSIYFSMLLNMFNNLDVEQKNRSGSSVIDYCANLQNINKMNILLDKKPILSQESLLKCFFFIAKYGSLKEHAEYFENNLKIGLAKDTNNNNALMYAVSSGNMANTEFLLPYFNREAIISPNKHGNTVLDILELIEPEEKKTLLKQQIIRFFAIKTDKIESQKTNPN